MCDAVCIEMGSKIILKNYSRVDFLVLFLFFIILWLCYCFFTFSSSFLATSCCSCCVLVRFGILRLVFCFFLTLFLSPFKFAKLIITGNTYHQVIVQLKLKNTNSLFRHHLTSCFVQILLWWCLGSFFFLLALLVFIVFLFVVAAVVIIRHCLIIK